jgi:thiosulfate dehydrogenase
MTSTAFMVSATPQPPRIYGNITKVKNFILGVVVTVVAAALSGYIFLRWFAPVATDAAPMPLETWLAHTALNQRVDSGAPKNVPIAATPDNLMAGAKLYREHCAVCHALAGQPQTMIAKGEFPKPPQLLKGKGVTDDPAGETYWKITHGIRLTGMPGFPELSDTQRWQISLVLANAHTLPPDVTTLLNQPLSIQ